MFLSPIQQNQTPMFDTLTFSQKMQNSGMSSKIADELALSLRDMNKNHFDALLTRDEFRKSEEQIHNDFKDFKNEIRLEFKEFKEEMQNDFRDFKEKMQSDFREFKDEMQTEFKEFKEEMQSDFREFKEEMQLEFKEFKQEIRVEFANKLKNLELTITVRMGIMMATGISIIGLMIKM